MNHSALWEKKTLTQGVALLAGMALGLEAVLQISSENSLCQSAGCKLAGDALRIEEPYLVALGAGFFLFLAASLSLARWLKREWPWWSATALLFGALAFDGALLGFQVISMNERCLLCIIVGAGLILTLFLLGLDRKSWMIPAFGLAVFSGGFLGNAVISATPALPLLQETVFLHKKAEVDTPLKLYLYFSLHCEHCLELIASLAAEETPYAEWHLSATDWETQDLLRLSEIRDRVNHGENLFQSIVDVKQIKEVQAFQVPEEIKLAAEKARFFLLSNHHSTLPILIAEEGKGQRIINEGLHNIKLYLMSRRIITRYSYLQSGESRS
jgi:uncharacterized membrane protein